MKRPEGKTSPATAAGQGMGRTLAQVAFVVRQSMGRIGSAKKTGWQATRQVMGQLVHWKILVACLNCNFANRKGIV